MKQYAVLQAYTDNYHVIRVTDGVIEDDIITYYNLPGYVKALEGLGYTKAYFVPEATQEFKRAEEEYINAKNALVEAQTAPLMISDEQAKDFYFLAKYLENN